MQSRMSRDKLVEITQLKTRPVMRTANHSHAQRTRGSFVGPEDIRAFNFLLAIEPHQPCANGCPLRRKLRPAALVPLPQLR